MRSGVGGSVILQAQLAQDFIVGAFTAGESLALAYPMRVTVRGLGRCKRPGFHASRLGLQTYTERMMGEGCACGTEMTDLPLLILPAEVQKTADSIDNILERSRRLVAT
jgi:hypothetical protein